MLTVWLKNKGLLPKKSLNLNHFSVSFSQRKFISSYGNLNRIAKRSNFTDVNIYTTGDAHIHNAAFNSTLAVKLHNFDSLTNLCFLKC